VTITEDGFVWRQFIFAKPLLVLFMVASQYANLFHFICSSKDLSTTRFRSNSASANPRNLRLSLLRAFGAQAVSANDLYNHPTGAPYPNGWNNFATVQPSSLTSTSPPRCINYQMAEAP
jgi:hypothetical protein